MRNRLDLTARVTRSRKTVRSSAEVALQARSGQQTFIESRLTYLRFRTTSPPLVGRIRLLGTDAAKVAVPTGAIMESIDIVGDVRQRDVAARIDPLLDALLLQAAEGRLDHGIDAPMSSMEPDGSDVRERRWSRLADEVALETAHDLLARPPFALSPFGLLPGSRAGQMTPRLGSHHIWPRGWAPSEAARDCCRPWCKSVTAYSVPTP